MEIVRMTCLLVDRTAKPPFPALQPVDEVAAFLVAHVASFLDVAATDDAPPPAHFVDSSRCRLFEDLLTGDDQAFLAAAHALANHLVAAMTGRAKPGLLVAVHVRDANPGVVAGVLKLQVEAVDGAVLRKIGSGEIQLKAVKDLLDRPGRLQKGALVTEQLPAGRAICGDLQRNARYFPDALGLVVHPRPRQAARFFFDIVDEVEPALTGLVAEAFSNCRAESVAAVLDEISTKVAELTGPVRAGIERRLRMLPQPVFELDTKQVVREKYQIGKVMVHGPIADMRHLVRKERISDGRWQLVIETDEEPSGIWV